MPYPFDCPNCGEELDAEPDWVGELLDCPECDAVIEVPQRLRRSASTRSAAGRSGRQRNRGQSAPPEKNAGIALASLILGILALLTFGLFSIPAIICGHIGHNKVRNSNGALGGGGMAIAGFSMGYASLLLFLIGGILAAMILPALGKAREKAQEAQLMHKCKEHGTAITMYFSPGDNHLFPESPGEAFGWDLNKFNNPITGFKPRSFKMALGTISPWKFYPRPGDHYNQWHNSDAPILSVEGGEMLQRQGKLIVFMGDGTMRRESKTWVGAQAEKYQQLADGSKMLLQEFNQRQREHFNSHWR